MVLDKGRIHKILIIKLRAIGDVILSTIVTKNLRLAFPGARIDFLTEAPSRDIVSHNPYIDSALVFDKKTTSSRDLLLEVRGRRYDLVIDLFGNPRSALVTRLSGALYRVGFNFRGRRYAYNITVQGRGGTVHNTQFNLDAIEAIGVPVTDRSIHFSIPAEDEVAVGRFLNESGISGRLIGLLTGGGWYTKRWPLERFAELADRLIERHRAGIVLTWGPGELEDARSIQSKMKHPAFIPPSTSLPRLAALLKRCSFVIANDSGPMHLAAAVGTPVLGIFGPTEPALQGPYGDAHRTVRKDGLECLGCNLTKCPIGHPCMLELSVDRVFERAEELITTPTSNDQQKKKHNEA